MLSTLGRATKVLDLFTVDTPEWGATAVAHELQIAKSQAHELLVSLAVGGLLQRVGMGRYRLGWRIVALNAVLVETSDLLRLVAPEMQALVGRYGETVHVAVWDGRPVCIDARSGRLNTSIPPFRVGADLPACSTALGKVLLAGRPRDEITQFLSGTELDPIEDVQVGLGQVAAQGFAYEEQEYLPGSCSVAAPIINQEAGVFASIGMSVPVDRWERGRLGYRRAVVSVASHLARCSGQLQRSPEMASA
jgi:IclR family KDG regulon transcriptional repressor